MTAALAPRPSCPPSRRVAVRPAPRREPPFDDEVALTVVAPGPLDRRLPFELVTRAPRRPVRTGPLRTGLADPATFGRRLLVAMIETAGGRRPAQQLATLLSPSVHRGVAELFDRAGGRTPHWLTGATVRSVRVSEPADGVAELAAVLGTGPRARAVAMRLELQRDRWRCTRLQLG